MDNTTAIDVDELNFVLIKLHITIFIINIIVYLKKNNYSMDQYFRFRKTGIDYHKGLIQGQKANSINVWNSILLFLL